MARFTCTNCGYEINNVHPREDDLSCPGCRHRLETDEELDREIQEQDQIFFEELMSGQMRDQFVLDEPTAEPESEQSAYTSHAEVQAVSRHYSPRFEGSAGGYFRVWIVNVILSIMTLGIFMVHGRERVRKYFLNKIVIDGHPLASVKDYENIYEYIMVCSPENARLGNLTIDSSAKTSKLFWIRFSNFLVSILSFGLIVPWAKVRRVRYIIRNITIITDQNFEDSVSDAGKST